MGIYECESCEVKVEITVIDHLIETGVPDIKYCPNCGKETLEDV